MSTFHLPCFWWWSCNFSTSTVWEGSIQEGMHYIAEENLGYQFIGYQIIAGRAWNATLSWTEIEQVNLTSEH
jgi:hypothetical protein